MSLSIVKPGLLTTVQDVGRYGYQKYGTIVSGAMDVFSLKCANILVGNDEQEAVLEMTFVGATIRFDSDVVIAICGGDFSPSIDDQPLPMWKGIFVQKGSTLTFGKIKSGSRCYLAVAGGFDILKKFNSRSTYLKAKLGGLEGRALKAGDRLYVRKGKRNVTDHMLAKLHKQDRPFLEVTATMSTFIRPNYAENPIIRILKGLQHELFDDASIEVFFSEPFAIEPQSDRMGYRLSGKKLALKQAKELLSEAIAEAVYQVDPELILFGLANSELIKAGKRIGLRTGSEVFADRTYEEDGTLTPRWIEGAVMSDENEAVQQVLRMVKEKKVRSRQGTDVEILVETICIHGDGANAVSLAKTIRNQLEQAGIMVCSIGK
ncbi:LamB/YcsF family protein [Aeribacillus pallidus]|nr:LamB/YcsF family protein [Aeribacillus pallidus]